MRGWPHRTLAVVGLAASGALLLTWAWPLSRPDAPLQEGGPLGLCYLLLLFVLGRQMSETRWFAGLSAAAAFGAILGAAGKWATDPATPSVRDAVLTGIIVSGALVAAAALLVAASRVLSNVSRLRDRIGQAVIIAGLVSASLPAWHSLAPEASPHEGILLIVLGAATLLNLPVSPADGRQFALNVAVTDIGLSVTWGIFITVLDHDVSPGVGAMMGFVFAQVVVLIAAVAAVTARSLLRLATSRGDARRAAH